MKIYLAAAYARREQMQHVAHRLEQAGHHVTSRWINRDSGDAAAIDACPIPGHYRAAAGEIAQADLDDIKAANLLIAVTESAPEYQPLEKDRTSRGGRHVELGYALALGKKAAIVGPLENIFCALARVYHYHTLDDLCRKNALAFMEYPPAAENTGRRAAESAEPESGSPLPIAEGPEPSRGAPCPLPAGPEARP